MESPSILAISLGRVAQVTIALWLLPALLAVLVVGTIGVLALEARRRFAGVLMAQACSVRDSVGLDSFRS